MSTTTTTTITSQIEIPQTLRWHPLPTPVDVDVESQSVPVVLQTPSRPVPCRRCLQDSEVGEQMILFSYDPFTGASPYSCRSPIYVHAKSSCKLVEFPSAGGILPEQQRKRPLAVRAYDKDHMMVEFDITEGENVVETCEQMLSRNGAEYLHLYYAKPGCFAVRVDKGTPKA